MKLIDFDGLFDEKLAQFMEENATKYTEREWEDVIPKLYKKFGDTYVAKIKCTPKEYFAKMTDEDLVNALCGYLKEDVPAPEFLCTEIENRGATKTLLPLLESEDETLVTYAFNLIGDDKEAYDVYFDIITQNRCNEDVRSDITDVFRLHADELKDKTLSAYKKGLGKEYMLEILSRVKTKDEEVFQTLLSAFLSHENNAVRAGYLASYGDERALSYLLKQIDDKEIGFVEFQELKYAIEALGGEYNEPRDFSADKDYIAIEVESAKFAAAQNQGLKN